VTVFAASSLTDAFTAAGPAFARHTPNSDATFSFAGSQDLAAQIAQGAPADALATADETTMQSAKANGDLAAPPQVLAHNRLVIVTEKGNPHHIATLAELAGDDLVVVLADPSVPAGSYAKQALDAAHVDVRPASLEPDVRSALTKVEVGEADAAIVYATDAASAAGKVASVPIANAPTATYEIAPVTDAGSAFVDFLLSSTGQRILRRYGFLPP
jgi:molybdate transport system substrate-binding protein